MKINLNSLTSLYAHSKSSNIEHCYITTKYYLVYEVSIFIIIIMFDLLVTVHIRLVIA